MRYYSLILNTDAEEIKESAKINLREYGYNNPIASVNNYLYQNMKCGISFLMYREEAGKGIKAIFCYNERKNEYKDIYDYILDTLNESFLINRVISEPCEITMYQFFQCIKEARRRQFFEYWGRYVEDAKLGVYSYYSDNTKSLPYSFEERIISENIRKENKIYDEHFINELTNIDSHKMDSMCSGNMVHYIISARSIEAASDMTDVLMQHLYKANRISSRRMEIIRDIDIELFKVNNHLEEIIENNYGGVVVFDLSEKFGCDPVDYKMTSEYIENLLKKYKNDCLFVFTYNMENPGFSYFLLPNLKKYVIPIFLREGTGNRKVAVSYMKELIKGSEYSEHANQAAEFMKLFSGKQFSQTDVLRAYEQFEPWCLNKNMLQMYDYNFSDDFMLDRNENVESSYEKLQKMIGLGIVKEQINNIIATNIVEKERKRRKRNSYKSGTMHMIFGGNPGTAKTTVAKLFAGIAKEKGILKSGALVERGGMDLDGLACNIKIRDAFVAAKGGVLFIDEAYSMKSDYAVSILIQEMENHREDVIVILAGYNERMQSFMEINEGLKSRIPYWIDFPDYSTDELTEIFKMMMTERGFTVTDDAIGEASHIFEKVRLTDNFGNGRYVRNLMERAIEKQSVRLMNTEENISSIRPRELFTIKKEDLNTLEEGLKEERINGTAKKELEDMIGLGSAKAVINKAIAGFKLNKLCMEKGISKGRASLHMVFTGNPGTAKTTVARLFAEIMRDEKVLPTGKFIEVGRADLIGSHVGATAPLVKKRFREAQGGVLFIDEAYSLCDAYENGYGDEAINTIVQEMENHRDNVIVVFAGYPKQMQQFLDRNPGLRSRIAYQVEFEDYSVDELCDITKLMLTRKEMTITDSAMEKLKKKYEEVCDSSDYGNGRFVRKMLEEAEMNLADRILRLNESEITTQLLTTIEEEDISQQKAKKQCKKQQMGFC